MKGKGKPTPNFDWTSDRHVGGLSPRGLIQGPGPVLLMSITDRNSNDPLKQLKPTNRIVDNSRFLDCSKPHAENLLVRNLKELYLEAVE